MRKTLRKARRKRILGVFIKGKGMGTKRKSWGKKTDREKV